MGTCNCQTLEKSKAVTGTCGCLEKSEVGGDGGGGGLEEVSSRQHAGGGFAPTRGFLAGGRWEFSDLHTYPPHDPYP